jgi:predicted amidohydrolase YtcJ
MSSTTIFSASRIHPDFEPGSALGEGSAVAVTDGYIVGIGPLSELQAQFGGEDDVAVDTTFADKVVVPGFVEAHAHSIAGGLWNFTYCGFFDRTDPSGRTWTGCKSVDDVIRRLQEAEAALEDPDVPLLAWGLDPIYLTSERVVAIHLDQVSATRPIFVFHASLHLATVNTALMNAENITSETLVEGVARDAAGEPNGELQEPAAMSLATGAFREMLMGIGRAEGLWNWARLARNAGVTTMSDLGTSPVTDERHIARWREAVDDPAFPTRVSVFHNQRSDGGVLDEVIPLIQSLADTSSPKLRFGHVKLVLDGSIQGFTARLRFPYHELPEDAAENGLWLLPPEQVVDIFGAFHRAGITVHAHCNGDETTELFLEAVAAVYATDPPTGQRHCVQHSQLSTPEQYATMAGFGLSANVFSNHTFYWGDQHRDITVGPERAAGMNAARTALDAGVQLSMHSDAPVTPIGPLHVAWCAVNRRTATDQVLGAEEAITVGEALAAVTVGAAYQLHLDDEVGTLEVGKRADFAVLDADPLEVDPMELKDVGVWGTVLGGVAQPAELS